MTDVQGHSNQQGLLFQPKKLSKSYNLLLVFVDRTVAIGRTLPYRQREADLLRPLFDLHD
jgi:hypothetical protein